jgi:hypothetical protein
MSAAPSVASANSIISISCGASAAKLVTAWAMMT